MEEGLCLESQIKAALWDSSFKKKTQGQGGSGNRPRKGQEKMKGKRGGESMRILSSGHSLGYSTSILVPRKGQKQERRGGREGRWSEEPLPSLAMIPPMGYPCWQTNPASSTASTSKAWDLASYNQGKQKLHVLTTQPLQKETHLILIAKKEKQTKQFTRREENQESQ